MNVFEKIREKIEEKAFSVQIKQGIKEPSTFDAMMDKFSVLEIKEVINQVEQEHNNGWIACSERLPKEDERVLCFHSHYFIDCGVLVGEEWCCDMDEYAIKIDNVIAWQPLPQPYKERD